MAVSEYTAGMAQGVGEPLCLASQELTLQQWKRECKSVTHLPHSHTGRSQAPVQIRGSRRTFVETVIDGLGFTS